MKNMYITKAVAPQTLMIGGEAVLAYLRRDCQRKCQNQCFCKRDQFQDRFDFSVASTGQVKRTAPL